MEEIKNVTTVSVDYKCTKCNIGYMRPTGMALTCHPPKYPHICNYCEVGETFRKTYPYLSYE